MKRYGYGIVVGAVAMAFAVPAEALAQRPGGPPGKARAGASANTGGTQERDPLEGLRCENRGGVLICTPDPDRRRTGDDDSARDRRVDEDRRSSRDGGVVLGGRDEARGGGPPFCRNGEGHPVFGMRWCREKGFSTGGIRWEPAGWEDIVLRAPRRTGVNDGTLDAGTVIDVLGDIVLGRFSDHGRRLGADGPLTGHWTNRDGADELLLFANDLPIARLRDRDGDRRVDRVLLNAGR